MHPSDFVNDLFTQWLKQYFGGARTLDQDLMDDLKAAYRAGYVDAASERRIDSE
jgi:hypothetical protein